MNKPLTTQDQVKNTLAAMTPQFQTALPSHVTPKRFIQIVLTAVLTNESLLRNDRTSLYKACLELATMGLMPDGNEAALVPFRGKVKAMPMVRGIIKKLQNSGEIASLTAQIVHENDLFDFYVDENGEHLSHSPAMFAERGDPIGVYALAKTNRNNIYVEIMTTTEIAAIRGISSSSSGPWSGPFKMEMWKKSAIRRLAKRLPMSSEVEQTIQHDDYLYNLNKGRRKDDSAVNQRLEQLTDETKGEKDEQSNINGQPMPDTRAEGNTAGD